jgi:hypothetical protein
VTSRLEHLFLYLLSICMSSYKMCLFNYWVHFLNGLLDFFGVNIFEPLLYSGCQFLVTCTICVCFLPFCRFSFNPVSSAWRCLVCCNPTCLFLFLLPVLLGPYLKITVSPKGLKYFFYVSCITSTVPSLCFWYILSDSVFMVKERL